MMTGSRSAPYARLHDPRRPAAGNGELLRVSGATPRATGAEKRKKLHRLVDDPAIAELTLAGDETI
jgi:hypothetical protein